MENKEKSRGALAARSGCLVICAVIYAVVYAGIEALDAGRWVPMLGLLWWLMSWGFFVLFVGIQLVEAASVLLFKTDAYDVKSMLIALAIMGAGMAWFWFFVIPRINWGLL